MFRREIEYHCSREKRMIKKAKAGNPVFGSGISDTCGSCFGGIYDVQAGSSQP